MRIALRCILVLVCANLAFLAIRIATSAVDKDLVRDALRSAYADGALTTDAYPRTMFGGYDQFSDCVTAQVAALGGKTPVRDAIVPRVVSPLQVGPDFAVQDQNACLDLKRFLDGSLASEPAATYSRFWHGAASAVSAALLALPVDGYRALLLDLTLGLIALCAVLAALASRPLLLALAPLLVVCFGACGETSYGHQISYGPAAISAWGMACITITLRHSLTPPGMMLLATLAGALEAFFDQLISVPLNASIFLIVACACSAPAWAGGRGTAVAADVAGYVLAWFFGLGGSYLVKLGLSMALLGWAPLTDFIQQLAFRAGTIDPDLGFGADQPVSRLALLGQVLLGLTLNIWRLGYTGGRSTPVVSLAAATIGLAGWAAAAAYAVSAIRKGTSREAFATSAGYLAAAAIFAVWVIALPEHTLRHSFFMVRSAIVWLIGGWGCLFAASYAEALSSRVPERITPADTPRP